MITDVDLLIFFRSDGKDDWGEWRKDPSFPYDDLAFENNKFSVLGMQSSTDLGDFIHVMIRTKAIDKKNFEPRWRDKQRIKNELFGKDFIAIEIMPRHEEVVATADVYHIWIVPPQFALPKLV